MKHCWLALPPLTSYCVAQFLTGQGLVPVHGRGIETTILLPPIPPQCVDSSVFFPNACTKCAHIHTCSMFMNGTFTHIPFLKHIFPYLSMFNMMFATLCEI